MENLIILFFICVFITEITPLIIGIVVGVTFVSGLIALVSILLIKYTSPKVRDHNFNNNNKRKYIIFVFIMQ